MFEKDAQRSFDELDDRGIGDDWSIEESYVNGFSNGAEFGYNKANEWHDLKKNPEDLPKDRELYFVIIETDDGLKEPDVSCLGTDKRWACEDYSIRVIAWKEIALPKEIE